MQTTREKVSFITLSEKKKAPKVGTYIKHKNAIIIKKYKGNKIEVFYTDQNGLVMKATQGGAMDSERFKELMSLYLSENKDEIKRILNIQEVEVDPDDLGIVIDPTEFVKSILGEIEKLKPESYGSLISEKIGERPNQAFVKIVPIKSGYVLSLLIEIFNSNLLVGQKLSLGNQSHYNIPIDMTIETTLGTLYMKKNGDVEFFVKYGGEDNHIRTSVQISL